MDFDVSSAWPNLQVIGFLCVVLGALAAIAQAIFAGLEHLGQPPPLQPRKKAKPAKRGNPISLVLRTLFLPLSLAHDLDTAQVSKRAAALQATLGAFLVPVGANLVLLLLVRLRGLEFYLLECARYVGLVFVMAIVGGLGFLIIRGVCGYCIGVATSGILGGTLLGATGGLFVTDFGVAHLGILALATGTAFGSLAAVLERDSRSPRHSAWQGRSAQYEMPVWIWGFVIGAVLGLIFNLVVDVVKGVDFGLGGYLLGLLCGGVVAALAFGIVELTDDGRITGLALSALFGAVFGVASPLWLEDVAKGVIWCLAFALFFAIGYFRLLMYPFDLLKTRACVRLSRANPVHAFERLPIFTHEVFWWRLYGLDTCLKAMLDSRPAHRVLTGAVARLRRVLRQSWVLESPVVRESTNYGTISTLCEYLYAGRELIMRVNQDLQGALTINAHDILSVRRAHRLDEARPDFIHKPKSRSPRYSEPFVRWLVGQFEEDHLFFEKARGAYRRQRRAAGQR